MTVVDGVWAARGAATDKRRIRTILYFMFAGFVLKVVVFVLPTKAVYRWT